MIIAVDFDGTLVEHKFPEMGKTKYNVLKWVVKKQREGAEIILWTCREGEYLQEAIDWCKDSGLVLSAINENVPSLKNKDFAIRKPYADIYLDDRNMLVREVK